MTTPTNDRQTSEREQIACDLIEHWPDDIECLAAAKILRADEAEIAQLKDVRDAYARKADALMEERDALRAENGRLLRERASEDVRLADVIAERDRLRAENEALRTVTDEDVVGVLKIYLGENYASWTNGGRDTEDFDEMRYALQSFIRSKESSRG